MSEDGMEIARALILDVGVRMRRGMETGLVVTCSVEQLLQAVWEFATGGGNDRLPDVVEVRIKCAQGREVVLRDDETARVEGG